MESMPWEFLFVIATIAFVFVLPLVSLVGYFDLQKRKIEGKSSANSLTNSLTVDELDAVIGQAVERAMTPMKDRMYRMESRMDVLEQRDALLDLEEGYEPKAERLKTVGRAPRARG